MKKLLTVLLSALMIFALVGCSGSSDSTGSTSTDAGNLVGVSMPTKSLQRWIQDGDNMKSQLEASGYTVDLQYAGDNDIPTQVSQIENMIANGCKVIVVASIDGTALGTVMDQAKEAGIPVIAYDRLIMNTDGVTYYATFDNWLVGVKQGEFIEEKLDLKNAKANGKTYNIEYITGDPGDNNINFFFDGAMSVLEGYVADGVLVTPSKQVATGDSKSGYDKATVATTNWATDAAQSRFENILSTYYADKNLDAVLASNDSTAMGVINALKSSYKGTNPVITGQDCDLPNVPYIADGTQGMAVFKDTRTLAGQVVKMVDAILKGSEPEINDTKTYDNGVKVVPSYLCEPVACTADNLKELLLDSGYYVQNADGTYAAK